jgi:hypothetical protein
MTKDEVNAILPEVLSTVRAWVNAADLARHAGAHHAPGAGATPAMTADLPSSMSAKNSGENLPN